MLLKAKVLSLTRNDSIEDSPTSAGTPDSAHQHSGVLPLQEVSVTAPSVRRGKAPPVEPYTGESPDILWAGRTASHV